MILNIIYINEDGSIFYYVNDKLHREDGPAIEWWTGSIEWYKDGILHREGGPAEDHVIWDKWFYNGELHRIDGSALNLHYANEYHWFYHGKSIDCSSQEEFERKIKLLAFL